MAAERADGPAGAVAMLAPCLDPGIAKDMAERHLLPLQNKGGRLAASINFWAVDGHPQRKYFRSGRTGELRCRGWRS